jgi:phosphoribosylformylglycinamidine synthase
VALAFGTPFISGKDSLNNEYHSGNRHIVIPPTLLISALGRVADVRRCVSMDLKEPGNLLFLIGTTRNEMGGSHFNLVHGLDGGAVPEVDLQLAPLIVRKLHEAIQRGLIRACHDLSEGGLAVAIAEMAFAGEIGVELSELGGNAMPDEVLLFSESCTRFVVEVTQAHAVELQQCFGSNVPLLQIGQTCQEPQLRITGPAGHQRILAALADLKEAWQKPLRW